MKKSKFPISSYLNTLLAFLLFAIYWYWINQKLISDTAHTFSLNVYFLLICVSTAYFPLPANLLVLGAVKNYDPLIVAVFGAVGTLVAFASEYLFFTFLFKFNRVAKFKNTWLYKKAAPLFKSHRFFTLSFASFLPLPTEPLRIYIISQKYSKFLYIFSGFIGRFLRYFLLGYYGKAYVNSVWFLVGVLLFPGIFLLLIRGSVSLINYIKVKYITEPLESQISLSVPLASSSSDILDSDLEQNPD